LSEAGGLAAPQGGGRPAAFDLFCRVFTYAWAVILLYPILFIVSLSLRRREELTQAVLGLIPYHVRWENYLDAFTMMARYVVPVPTLMLNSAIAVAGAVLGALIIAVLAAYAFAMMEFPGKRGLFYVVLLGLIVPIPMMLIPEFIAVKAYGLIGSRLSLILPYIAFGVPLPILILTTYFKTVPKELLEAAHIDGASHLRILRSVILPISRPALATCAIFLALTFWNEFPLALVIIHDPDLITVPVGLASVKGKGFSPWEVIAAVMLITSMPVIVVFAAFQRQFIEGLVQGSIKG
jgi:ABC-type glycerol-3-phosphate transport system permease component